MKNETIPFFSIVTISFNQEEYLAKCIESIIFQKFNNFEYIIQDPGSTDNSRKIISSYKNDPRIKISFEKDQSPSDGLNKAFDKARGRYFLFINSDDELCSNSLEILHEEIIKNPDFDVYSGAAEIIDSKDNILRLTFSDQMNIFRASYGQCILVQPSTVFKSSIFRKVGGFNKDNLISWDSELFFDFALASAKFKVFKKIISKYRITNKSITGSGLSKKKITQEQKRIYKKINNRRNSIFFSTISFLLRLQRKFLNVEDTFQRIFNGRISGRFFDE